MGLGWWHDYNRFVLREAQKWENCMRFFGKAAIFLKLDLNLPGSLEYPTSRIATLKFRLKWVLNCIVTGSMWIRLGPTVTGRARPGDPSVKVASASRYHDENLNYTVTWSHRVTVQWTWVKYNKLPTRSQVELESELESRISFFALFKVCRALSIRTAPLRLGRSGPPIRMIARVGETSSGGAYRDDHDHRVI